MNFRRLEAGHNTLIQQQQQQLINSTDDAEALKEGMELIRSKFTATLNAKGLKAMDAKAGDEFDLDKHEAIANVPAPSEDLKGKIVDVVEKGYMLGDKVLRYAKVVIGA